MMSQRRISLRFLSGNRQGTELALEDPSELVVGRGPGADLVLSEGMVSRRHVRLRLHDGVLALEELGSTNGTFVNGARVTARELISGDRVLIGTSICRVAVHDEPRAVVRDSKDGAPGAAEVATEVTGDLAEVSVIELIEMFARSRQDVLLELVNGRDKGALVLLDGRVVACSCSRLRGMRPSKVLLRLASWTRGSFEVRAPSTPIRCELARDGVELAVELREKLDELEILRKRLFADAAELFIPRPMLPSLSELDEAGLALLRLAHNLGCMQRVLDECELDDGVIVAELLTLIDRGFLRRT